MDKEAMTLREAALRAGLGTSAIRGLLKAGDLDGPPLLPGRKRHPKNAKRVYLDSLEECLRQRSHAHPDGAPRRAATARGPADATGLLALKITLDRTREQLRRERAAQRALLRQVAVMTEQLSEALDATDAMDDLATGYSGLLSQLLTPDDVGDLG